MCAKRLLYIERWLVSERCIASLDGMDVPCKT